MTSITPADFEKLYRADRDPWNYRSSRYEREKYDATLVACGPGPFAAALELGSSIGHFSARLAPRCLRLITLDCSPTAVGQARTLLASHPHVDARLAELPAAIPPGPFDLVVASEILYYLDAKALTATLSSLEHRLAGGGRLVCVHWRPAGPERPFDAATVHRRVRALRWLTPLASGGTDDYLLDVLERR